MSLRLPAGLAATGMGESALNLVDQEIIGEMASSLGNAGRKVEACLARLRASGGEGDAHTALLKATADAVYAYFIQRELCGLRRHETLIRDMGIPREVLVRLGAR